MSGRHAALVGCTASGKSALALAVARRFPEVELVSLDSMQVYRGMDIGTAKPSPDEQAEVSHHLIDLVEPDEEMTVARFQAAYREVLTGIEDRGGRALLVGGTGLYFRAAVDGLDLPGRYPEVRGELEEQADTVALHRRLRSLDPTAAARMEPGNRRRVIRALEVTLGSGRAFSSFGPGLETYARVDLLLLGVRLPRPVIDRRIEERYRAQLTAGFVDEVEALLARRGELSATARQALGYRELLDHLEGGLSLEEAVATAVRRTRRFARRQERWFRRDPRIQWLETDHDPQAVLPDLVDRLGWSPPDEPRRRGATGW